jgi:hypothetical protein
MAALTSPRTPWSAYPGSPSVPLAVRLAVLLARDGTRT